MTAPTVVGEATNIAINTANLSLVVGSAVTRKQLREHLAASGVECTAISTHATQRTVGELIADATGSERAAVRHGLLGLEVTLPDDHAFARFGGET